MTGGVPSAGKQGRAALQAPPPGQLPSAPLTSSAQPAGLHGPRRPDKRAPLSAAHVVPPRLSSAAPVTGPCPPRCQGRRHRLAFPGTSPVLVPRSGPGAFHFPRVTGWDGGAHRNPSLAPEAGYKPPVMPAPA